MTIFLDGLSGNLKMYFDNGNFDSLHLNKIFHAYKIFFKIWSLGTKIVLSNMRTQEYPVLNRYYIQ